MEEEKKSKFCFKLSKEMILKLTSELLLRVIPIIIERFFDDY